MRKYLVEVSLIDYDDDDGSAGYPSLESYRWTEQYKFHADTPLHAIEQLVMGGYVDEDLVTGITVEITR